MAAGATSGSSTPTPVGVWRTGLRNSTVPQPIVDHAPEPAFGVAALWWPGAA